MWNAMIKHWARLSLRRGRSTRSVLRGRDWFVVLSFILIAGAPAGLLILGTPFWFGFDPATPARVLPQTPEVVAVVGPVVVFALLLAVAYVAGRYLWAVAMARWLTRAEVAPFLARNGRFRALGHLERWIFQRLYKR